MLNGGFLNDAQVNGFVPGDEEVYQLWLRSPSAPVGHIVHLGYHGTSAVYPNYVAYTAKLTDFPLAGYREVVKALPSFTRQISDDLSGEVTASIGELVLDNSDGRLDLWHNLALDGQPVRVYHGDPSWSAERFRLLIECLAESVTSADLETISIRLRGFEHGANVPLQTSLIPASVTATAPSNLPIPKAYGNVFNATPAIIDEANSTRQWNDGAVTAVTDARDDGSRFRTPQIAISAVNAGTDTLSTAAAHGFVRDTRVRCDIGTLPAVAQWSSIAWSGQLYCAIAYDSAIAATSPDGIVWTQRTLPFTGYWNGVAWNGAVFCAVAYGTSLCATSPDGVTWTQRSMPVSSNWQAIAWNGTVFCAIAYLTSIAATSPDGITWTQRALPSSANWQAIAWNGTVFCAVTVASTTAATSPDGATWTARTLPSVANWQALTWGGTVFCAVAYGSNKAATSPDGITWTAQTLPSSTTWTAVAWNGATFCAVAVSTASAATSPDGVTWTARTLPATSGWYAIAWNGYVFCTLGASLANYVTVSADGITWSAVTNTLPAPLAINTDYWVISDGLTTTDFRLAATRGGSVINITGTDTGALLVGFHWTASLTDGKIYLDSKPSGVFTIDGTAGTTAPGTILQTVLGAVNVDAQSFTRFATTCAQQVGYYAAERVNKLDVARDIMSGLGAWYGYNRHTLLQAGRIAGTYTTHDFELIEDQMDDGSFVLERMVPPAKRHRVSYRKNWTNQAGKLVAGVSPEARGLYSTDYSASAPILGADEGADGSEFHKLALRPDVIESLMTYGGDAQTEALRRDAMFYGWGAIFSCTVGRVGAEMDPGKVVKVTHSRYGLSAGVRMALVYVEDRPSDRATVLKFFAALSAYTPGQL